MGREPDGTLITLLDENGEEKEFEHLASLEYEGSTYVALIPAFQKPEELVESDGNLVILKIESDDKGEDILVTVDDDDEFYTVSKKFEKMLENEYEIIDDEDETNDVE
ncbi:hypothetical protein CCDG5_1014 [[Clostridium] cellulosi]|uniref:Uncharacterized protein n=1 Tax=[Clostridium] cellulosi TaxID=29343 RepID=A0A078KKC3_9FIRM|nr:hypothetical protein CCDG5_1014 [[Clostridium] cellulosi]